MNKKKDTSQPCSNRTAAINADIVKDQERDSVKASSILQDLEIETFVKSPKHQTLQFRGQTREQSIDYTLSAFKLKTTSSPEYSSSIIKDTKAAWFYNLPLFSTRCGFLAPIS